MQKFSKYDQQKYDSHFCLMGDNKGNPHQAGKWEFVETDSVFKLRIRRCEFCGKKLNEKVVI